jgi:hypothetical protein
VRSGASDRRDGGDLRREVERVRAAVARGRAAMAHGGMAHLAWHGQATAARDVLTGGLGRVSGRLRTGVSRPRL